MIVVGLFIYFMRMSNEDYKFALKIEKEMRYQQKMNYESILERERDTRKFRHDFQNHMICLMMKLKYGQVDGAILYISQIETNLKDTLNQGYDTGNQVIDAILNYYLGEAEDDIQIDVIGKVTDVLDIEDVDLCSIVSNAVKNAIEAVNIQSEGKKKISINFKQKNGDLFISLRNTCNKISENTEIFYTRKKDKRNHGFGIINMRNAVEKNKGEIVFKPNKNEFLLVIKLPSNKLSYH
jgi:sensor histidine kinase regulating citrate/malate metabolism